MYIKNGSTFHRSMTTEAEDDFYYSLQRYSALYRIILSRPYLTEIYINKWNRIDLKLVNEFGMTLKGEQNTQCWLEVGCHLLREYESKISYCQEYSIQCRPLQHDAWEFNGSSDITGFQNSADGGFEYMISAKDEKLASLLASDRPYYIQIFPTCHKNQTVKAFPLMIGPLYISEKETPILRSDNGWKEPSTSQDIFHGYRLQDNSFLVIKEDWDIGTPGKMWDSALVLSHMLSDKIARNPMCFKGKRLLDLSAGTGCVGLLIASIYRANNIENRPNILMTDLSEALDLIFQNRSYNNLESFTDVKPLEWGNFNDVHNVLKDGPLDFIIASDVLYKPSSFQSLVQTLDWLSRDNPGIRIILGYKRRGLDIKTEQTFFDICSEYFTIQHLVNTASTNEGWILDVLSDVCKETGVNIYQLVRK